MKSVLFAAASALVLSTAAASAAPAVTEVPVNLHAGPSLRSPVVGTVPGGARVDVRGCTHSWCRVRFAGERGFAPRRLLAFAGGPAAVAVAPGYVYDEPGYDYYDYGYTYGPSFGIYASPGFRHGWRGHGRWNANHSGTWQGNQGWSGNRSGSWQGRAVTSTGGARTGTAGVARGGMAPGSVSPQVSAPAAMSGGASVGGAGAVSTPPAGGAAAGAARGAVSRR